MPSRKRRNRKLRRRLRITLKSGHEARHKLISGRTGKVHSVKMLSPKKSKPTGQIELLIAPSKPQGWHSPQEEAPIKIQSAPIVHTRRRRTIISGPEPIEVPEIIEAEVITSVSAGEEALGFCLKAVDSLTRSIGNGNQHESMLLQQLLKAIDQYERK